MKSGRRSFLRNGIAASVAFLVSGCRGDDGTTAASSLPVSVVGRVRAGTLDDVLAGIAERREPLYVPDARAYVSPFPAAALEHAKKVYPAALWPALEAGVIVQHQRCTHLGCRVPWCSTSQWFECPCHAAYFDRAGERRGGPAPRGLDLFAARVRDGVLEIDTNTVYDGMPIGTDTTQQPAEGPHCV